VCVTTGSITSLGGFAFLVLFGMKAAYLFTFQLGLEKKCLSSLKVKGQIPKNINFNMIRSNDFVGIF
jgi:hypothetical protein